MKTLICGFGSIGRRHLNNLRALGETDFVLLRSHQSTLPETDINGIPDESDINDALAHQPDAVVVSNPTALHLQVAIPAAQAGCAILMEKPVSHNLDRVEELHSAVDQHGNRLLVGFQYRFHPVLIKVREFVQAQEIGKPISFRVHWGEYLPGWHPWENYRQSYSARPELGGGVVNTLSHPLDYLRWIFGEVDSVWAFTSSAGLGLDVEDSAEIGLRFISGLAGTVHLDYVQQPGKHTLEIIGANGMIAFDNATACAKVYRTGQTEPEEILPPAGFERNTLFLAEMQHFINVANRIDMPICDIHDGIAALKLTMAVHQSSRGGELVKLDQPKE